MLRAAIARVPAAAEAMPAWLGESERRRWDTLAPAARAAFVASRALLRELLRAATGVAAWDVSAEAGTAPVARAAGFASPIHVSLSHRLGWVAAAVADTAVGIDLEVARTSRSDPDERAALMLAPTERADWQAVAPADREHALLARWTAKEAWFKAMPAQAAPWDFRRVGARACVPRAAHANVCGWRAGALHVALCCELAEALAQADCAGLPTVDDACWWRVEAA